jgi:acetyltransferase-like isoleucine patch superfamily enzyme
VVREEVSLGVDSMVGLGCGLGRFVAVGDRTRIQAYAVIGKRTTIEEDCFLGPAAHILSGRTMGDPPRETPPILRRGCQIGSGVEILPGVEIGQDAIVGAGAVVAADVAPASKVVGIPARLA